MSATPKKKGTGSYRLRILANLKDQMTSFDKSKYTLEEVMRLADMTRSQVVNLSRVGLVVPRWRTTRRPGPGGGPCSTPPRMFFGCSSSATCAKPSSPYNRCAK